MTEKYRYLRLNVGIKPEEYKINPKRRGSKSDHPVPGAEEKEKYEKAFSDFVETYGDLQVEDALNILGLDGWKLVGVEIGILTLILQKRLDA